MLFGAGKRSVLGLVAGFAANSVAAAGLEPPDEPAVLSPVHPELPPGFWEQYWGWILTGGILFLIALSLIVWWKLRRVPPVVIPIEVQVRRELEALMLQTGDGGRLSRISRALRYYLTTAFVLSEEEMTTNELARRLNASGSIGPELAPKLIDFFQACDKARFSPGTPVDRNGDHAVRALNLLEEAERRRTLLRQAAAAQPPVYR